MNCKLFTLVFLSVVAITSAKTCTFGNEVLQAVYNRFENFRQTKAFDPDDPNVPLRQYHYYVTGETSRLAIKIGEDYMVEYYKINADTNEIETEHGQFQFNGTDQTILNYRKTVDGYSFDDWSNGKKFNSQIRSITEEPTDPDFEERYKTLLVILNQMRDKMFRFQKSLSKEDIELVQLFELNQYHKERFHAHYIENKTGSLSVSKNAEAKVSGYLSCDNRDQKFNIVDGRLIVDGEPAAPTYY